MASKGNPSAPPPAYAHNKPETDAGPYAPPTSPPPGTNRAVQPYNPPGDIQPPPQGYFGGQQQFHPQQENNYYGPPQPYGGQQANYGPPQPGMYPYGPAGGPPPGMYYQQQPGYGYPPQGRYAGDRGMGGSGAGEGFCAAIVASLACCCCLDLLLF